MTSVEVNVTKQRHVYYIDVVIKVSKKLLQLQIDLMIIVIRMMVILLKTTYPQNKNAFFGAFQPMDFSALFYQIILPKFDLENMSWYVFS